MGLRIVGDHPEGGIRFDLERGTEEAPWVYEGSAFTREVDHKIRASVDAKGVVTVDDEETLPTDVVHRVKLLLRIAWKHADGAAPPRRLHRWRAS